MVSFKILNLKEKNEFLGKWVVTKGYYKFRITLLRGSYEVMLCHFYISMMLRDTQHEVYGQLKD